MQFHPAVKGRGGTSSYNRRGNWGTWKWSNLQIPQLTVVKPGLNPGTPPISPFHCHLEIRTGSYIHLARYVSNALWSFPQRDLRCQKGLFSSLKEPAKPQRSAVLLLGRRALLPFHQGRMQADSDAQLMVTWNQEGDKKRGNWEATSVGEWASVNAPSTQSERFHSPSLFLIIRADYVQAKGEHVPKFMSLCATPTMRVLCASPWKTPPVTQATQPGLGLSCASPTLTGPRWQIFLKV